MVNASQLSWTDLEGFQFFAAFAPSREIISTMTVKVDGSNDLALLKAEGRFAPLAIAASSAVKLGGTVAGRSTGGNGEFFFRLEVRTASNPSLFPPLAPVHFPFPKGEIASLSGAGDDARYFQISVPVQSGCLHTATSGALVDESRQVGMVGVVSAKLSARAALASSGALPENVNYAVKSSYLLSFLESVPEVSAKLKEPRTAERKFEEVVKDAEQASVLVLVY